jgi:RNA polymerase sigma-70 factor, ECF subfamily
LEEREIIDGCLHGNPEAERQLYERNVDRIFRLTFRMTGDEEQARDCTQETFIRAYRYLPGFQGRAALSSWLHSIAVSIAINHLRKRKRIQKWEVPVNEEVAGGAVAAPARVRLQMVLSEAIDRLTEDVKLVFIMHDIEGYTHAEIAEILDIPSGTSKSRLFSARVRLREHLSQSGWQFALEDE